MGSQHNQNFQTTHSFGFNQKSSSYHFGSVYANGKTLLHGQVDQNGVLQARANYNWLPVPPPPVQDPAEPPKAPEQPKNQSTSKFQAQLSPQGQQSVVILEHEHVAPDYSISIKSQNANPVDKPASWSTGGHSVTGVFSVSYLQSISKTLALGLEWNYQRPFPDLEESSTSYALRYAPEPETLPLPSSIPVGAPSPYMPVNPREPTQVFTATYQPAHSMIHLSYWRRLNQRLEVATDVQMLVEPSSEQGYGRREAVASIGFKLDTVFATIRSSFETSGKIATVLEEKVTPNILFQVYI
jgi:mitochondrial import receptor subunit TOM40